MTAAITPRTKGRPVRPPSHRVYAPDQFPPREPSMAWAMVRWAEVAASLDAGKAIEFLIDPRHALDFWRYAQVRLSRSFAVRYHTRHKSLWLLPLNDPRIPAESAERRECRERLRTGALIRLIVADADAFAEAMELEPAQADAQFVADRGADRYPVAFDVATLQRWRAELANNKADLRMSYESPGDSPVSDVPMTEPEI